MAKIPLPAPTDEDRMNRANQMLAAFALETDRGKACVGDAILDELLLELFQRRFIDDPKLASEMVEGNQPLASYGVRLKLARALGWIGPETYRYCRAIHKIRNTVAHSLDVDSFSHPTLCSFFDSGTFPSFLMSEKNGMPYKMNLPHLKDRFLLALMSCVMRLWELNADSQHSTSETDTPIVRLPAIPFA